MSKTLDVVNNEDPKSPTLKLLDVIYGSCCVKHPVNHKNG
jgi:hypothetical protein